MRQPPIFPQAMLRFPIRILSLCVVLVMIPACQTIRFYGQAVGGQLEILGKSRPNDQVIADSATPSSLRGRLVTVERIRRFASEHLSLPGDESYGKYADLGRKHVVWVLYAAPEFSLEPKTWLYPAVGKMDYRGYFHEQDTVALAGQLRHDGYDVFIGGVDAYSTLGWFHDPVLNTFVDYPDADLAETIFHELTHRRVFHRGATAFNESLASVVAEEGVKRWLAHEGRLAELRRYEARLDRRREFYAEIVRSRRSLEALYASAQSDTVKRREKALILNTLREQVGELWRRWGSPGLEAWLAQNLNNGHLVSLKIYADQMPRLQELLAECDGDFERFFRQLEQVHPHSETAETRGSWGGS
jgi:predicted aminopeptidase